MEVGTALTSLKAAIDIAKVAKNFNSQTEINLAITDILDELLNAKEASLNDKERIERLSARVTELQKQLAKKEDWQSEKKRYILTKSDYGAYTYNLNADHADGEVEHRLCATCFENEKKSILHTKMKARGGETVFCQTCKTDLKLSKADDSARVIRTYNKQPRGFG